jgi:hypothetical protein
MIALRNFFGLLRTRIAKAVAPIKYDLIDVPMGRVDPPEGVPGLRRAQQRQLRTRANRPRSRWDA